MNVFISGGAKNGKSSYAQDLAVQMAKEKKCPLYYVATMIPHDDEDRARIERHRRDRNGMGFRTIECGRDIDRELCDATMDYFVQLGEFGNKSRDRASRIIVENRTLTDYLRYFDRSSTYSMPAAAKIPLMRPLAWSYQLFRYIRYLTKMALEKDSVSTMQKSIASGMQKRELLDRLKIRI